MRLLAALLCLSTVASTPPAAPPSDEETLRRLKLEDWPRAYREGDPALLDTILAREFQMVRADGGWSDKRAELEHVARQRATYRDFRFEIRRLEVFENGTAVVAGRGVVTGPESDPTGAFEYQSSNVLIKRDGRWQAILSHVSGVRPLPSQR